MTAVTPLRCNVCLEDISRNNPAYRLEHISLGNAVCEQAHVFDSKCIIQLQQCPMCRHTPIQAYKAGVLGKLQRRITHLFKTCKETVAITATGYVTIFPVFMLGTNRMTRVIVSSVLGENIGSFAGTLVSVALGTYGGLLQFLTPRIGDPGMFPVEKEIARKELNYGFLGGISLAITAYTFELHSEEMTGAGLLATVAVANVINGYLRRKQEQLSVENSIAQRSQVNVHQASA